MVSFFAQTGLECEARDIATRLTFSQCGPHGNVSAAHLSTVSILGGGVGPQPSMPAFVMDLLPFP